MQPQAAPGFSYNYSENKPSDLPVGQPVIPDVPSNPPGNNGSGAPQGGNPADLADLEARLKALDGL